MRIISATTSNNIEHAQMKREERSDESCIFIFPLSSGDNSNNNIRPNIYMSYSYVIVVGEHMVYLTAVVVLQ